MSKKVVLVTGGTSGIGYGTIEYLLEDGNYEIITVSRKQENVENAKTKLKDNADYSNQVETDTIIDEYYSEVINI